MINQISGNIFKDAQLINSFTTDRQNQNYKRLILQRHEMEKKRLRKKTEDGTDVGIVLEGEQTLQHGDVIMINETKILIEQEQEQIITIRVIHPEQNSNLFVILGHIIGNRHKPISFGDDGSISFPIQYETEISLFKTLFKDMIDEIELIVEEKIFQPHKTMNVHEH